MQFPLQIVTQLNVFNTNGQLIVQIGPTPAILIYDELSVPGTLIDSIASINGTDSFGNPYYAGFASYNTAGLKTSVGISGGDVLWRAFSGPAFKTPGDAFTNNPGSTSTVAAYLEIDSPESNGSPNGRTMIQLRSLSADNATQKPRITIGANTGDSSNVTVAMRGTVYAESYVSGTATQENWIAFSLLNGWITDPFTGVAPAYRRTATGMICCRGWSTAGAVAAGTVIATLPVGYRPGSVLGVPAMSPQVVAQHVSVVVRANGNIELYNMPVTASFSFDSISFFAGDVL